MYLKYFKRVFDVIFSLVLILSFFPLMFFIFFLVYIFIGFPIFVQKRPGVDKFLKEMSQYYEVVIFTASLSKYADPLMNQMDTQGICTMRLFREHCTYLNGVFTKDMSKIGRNMKDAMILDNSPSAYMLQPECAMPIISWYDDPKDRQLYDLIPLFK